MVIIQESWLRSRCDGRNGRTIRHRTRNSRDHGGSCWIYRRRWRCTLHKYVSYCIRLNRFWRSCLCKLIALATVTNYIVSSSRCVICVNCSISRTFTMWLVSLLSHVWCLCFSVHIYSLFVPEGANVWTGRVIEGTRTPATANADWRTCSSTIRFGSFPFLLYSTEQTEVSYTAKTRPGHHSLIQTRSVMNIWYSW